MSEGAFTTSKLSSRERRVGTGYFWNYLRKHEAIRFQATFFEEFSAGCADSASST